MADSYRPIACALHDELQLRALRNARVALRYRVDPGGPAGPGAAVVLERSACVADVRSRDGAEYLVLDSGEEIRLDRLVEVDGIPFSGAC